MSDMNRYHRQMLFQGIGQEGQAQLLSKHVLIIGCGALGSSSAEILIRAGVGKITIIDRDYVEWTNLQRQHLFTEEDVHEQTPKAIAAARKLKKINSGINIHAVVMDATVENLTSYVQNADIVIDATDNFDTRFLINDLAHKYRKPWIFGACVGSSGMTFTIIPGQTPCLDCLLKVTPMFGATCDAVGVIGPAVQMVVTHQTTEALKLLVEAKSKINSKLIIFDLWNNHYQTIDVSRAKRANCSSCGVEPTYPSLTYHGRTKTEVLCGRDTVQIRGKQYSLKMLESKLTQYGEVQANPFLVSVDIDEKRLVFFQDGRTFVHGTHSIEDAKKLYYQIVG
ncbi:adenylyltransferase and sulfurtransferase [Gracilibacillus orientalis]|uniref:Adenylyltransferase and sulfurtransferase n=1 Tax=Gracilibacillus orientalis TaxID=334253 RepID=A0A1I4QER9_9BACI|nr:ThiF family adenylyltransferase [Gracilibacillus orientalis]SFM38558.1 adenylyltransferase and sulfurtransferase [Gracilibacillus orientalis]